MPSSVKSKSWSEAFLNGKRITYLFQFQKLDRHLIKKREKVLTAKKSTFLRMKQLYDVQLDGWNCSQSKTQAKFDKKKCLFLIRPEIFHFNFNLNLN